MKRLATFAVLAAVAGIAPSISWGQTVHGYSKFTMNDPTRQEPQASSAAGVAQASYTADQGQPYHMGAAQLSPHRMAGYAGASPYSYAALRQNQAAPNGMMPQGAMQPSYSPYAPNANGAYPHGMQLTYPGYAPTPENMLYGGSPFPQVVPNGQVAPDYGYPGTTGAGCADGSCGPEGCASGGCAAGACGQNGCGHAGCGHGGCCPGGCGLGGILFGGGGCGLGHGACRPRHWIFGYDATADWISGGCSHGYVVFDALNWIPQGARVPALLTTSPIGTPQAQAGVIGQPGTQVLLGNSEFDDDDLFGGRLALGFWTMGAEYIGFEFNYMGFESGGTEFNAASSFNPPNGGGILAQPFFNVSTGAEDSLILAFPGFQALGGIIDGGGAVIDVNGSFALDSDLEIHSAGALLKNVVWVLPDAGWRMFFLAGYRFFFLGDDLDITSTIEPVGGPFAAGSRLTVFDSFDTENQFHGGELGLQTELATGPWSLGILTKVALGNVRQSLDIAGDTQTTSGGAFAMSPGGLFAQPTNIGSSANDEFAVLPEANLILGYQLTRRIKLTAGYNFLYINHVLRAAEQIDRSVNPTQFDGGMLVGEARPARLAVDNEFYMHGWSTGIEFKW